MKTWIKIVDNVVVASMVNQTSPGTQWIVDDDNVRITGIDGSPLYRLLDGRIVLIDAQRLHDTKMYEIRQRRNNLLSSTDWRVLSDAPGDTVAWKRYREALRDLPDATGFNVDHVVWPVPPAD